MIREYLLRQPELAVGQEDILWWLVAAPQRLASTHVSTRLGPKPLDFGPKPVPSRESLVRFAPQQLLSDQLLCHHADAHLHNAHNQQIESQNAGASLEALNVDRDA